MALAQQDFAKLMSPLKNALLGFFVALSPGTLDAASAKALNQAVEETVQNLAETESEKAKDQALEEALQNFGPSQTPETSEQGGGNFPEAAKNDIMTENTAPTAQTIPKPSIPQTTPSQTPATPSPTQTPEDQGASDQGKLGPQGEQDPNNPDSPEKSEKEQLSPEEMEKIRQEEELRKQQEAEAKLPTEKGAITQGINGLINGSRIKALKKQVKNLENKAKMWELAIRHQEKRISSLTRDKSRTEKKIKFKKTSITILKVFTWTLGFIIFFFLVPGAKIAQLKMESTLKTLQEHLESIIGKVANTQKNIADITKKITEIKQEIQKIVMTIYELYNENSLVGLVSGAARRISSKK